MTNKYSPEEVNHNFRFSVPLQVRFSDIDAYRHVNNGIYYNYMEHSRAEYLRQVCQWDPASIGAVVANIALEFYRPINFFDQVLGHVRCIRLGRSSFTLEQVLMGDKKGGETVVFSKATITMVTIDMKTMNPRPIPDDYLAKIRQHDGLEA